jgi:hypothetical protein
MSTMNATDIFPTEQYIPQELPEKTLCDIIKTWWKKMTTPGPPSKWDNEEWVRYQEYQ